MALLLIPIFVLSLVYTILGIFHVNNMLKLCVIASLGIFVMGISLPLVIVLLNGFTNGFIENQLSFLWSAAKLLTIANGDLYVGTGGFLLVAISSVFVATQILLIRSKKSNPAD